MVERAGRQLLAAEATTKCTVRHMNTIQFQLRAPHLRNARTPDERELCLVHPPYRPASPSMLATHGVVIPLRHVTPTKSVVAPFLSYNDHLPDQQPAAVVEAARSTDMGFCGIGLLRRPGTSFPC